MNKILRSKVTRRILTLIIIVSLVIEGLQILANVTKRTDSEFKYQPFFSENTDYDVLFFGTSHVINGIFPMQLWKDYGITSYNFGGHANSIAMGYWTMRNAVKYHKPKVAVLDVLGAEGQSSQMDISYAHLSLDAFPTNATKISGIKDMFQGDKKLQEELIYPFSIYHNKWKEISSDSLSLAFSPLKSVTREKGAESRINLEANPAKFEMIPKTEMLQDNTVALDYVRKFVDYCNENDIKPLLIYIPYPASGDAQRAANAVYKISEEKNVPFLNMEYDNLVDFDIDCFDPTSHLNPSGARKVTDFLGRWLTKNYGLKSHKDDTQYSHLWDKDYETYRGFLKENITNQTDLKLTLMLLNNENFYAEMYSTDKYKPDMVEWKLINQLRSNIKFSKTLSKDEAVNSSNDSADIVIRIYDKRDGSSVTTKRFRLQKDNIYNSGH